MVYLVSRLLSTMVMMKSLLFAEPSLFVIFSNWRCTLYTQHTDRFVFNDDEMDSDTVTESDMSLKS